jgi:hypothetical protein
MAHAIESLTPAVVHAPGCQHHAAQGHGGRRRRPASHPRKKHNASGATWRRPQATEDRLAPKARGLGLLRRRSSSGGHCLTRARLSRRLTSSLRPCSSCFRACASGRRRQRPASCSYAVRPLASARAKKLLTRAQARERARGKTRPGGSGKTHTPARRPLKARLTAAHPYRPRPA